MIISIRGNSVDLMRVLFGTVLAVDDASLLLIAGIASLSLLVLALVYRPLVVECFDPGSCVTWAMPGPGSTRCS